MDFTPELSAFQGVMLSADNIHNFSKLSCKGGNEEKVKSVIDHIKRFLINEGYIDENGIIDTMVSKMRKFAMYIILNSDLSVLENMVELEGIFLVIWSIPTIPKYLMCELLFNLHMEEFAWEIITYCQPYLASQVGLTIQENLKYLDPVDCLPKVHKLSAACYSLLCRLNCFEFEATKMKDIMSGAYQIIHKTVEYFVLPPNSHKLNSLGNDDLYKYKGECLKTILLLVYECFTKFTQDQNSSCFDPMYKATCKEEEFKSSPSKKKVCEIEEKDIIDCINNTNKVLLDKFKLVVMEISVDIFCAWSEFEDDDGKDMQQYIGELCHKVRMKLLQVSEYAEHPVVNMIQQMARQPLIIADVINFTDTNVIIQKINSNDQDKLSWIHALVNKEQLCQHSNLLSIIDKNIEVFDTQECFKLYNTFTNYYKSNSNCSEFVKTLAIKVFQYCEASDKHTILQDHFNENQFIDLSDDEHFHNVLTEMFNKFIASPNVDLTEVLNAFLQNPRQVYNKIFMLAKENNRLTSTMLNIMQLLKDYSNYYYVTETEPCIITITKNILETSIETEAQRENLLKFICGLKNNEIIPGTKLLLLIIMPIMHKALLSKDILKIHLQIQLLSDAYTVSELVKYRAPMLAMLSQVMDVVRWRNIKVFVSYAPMTLQLTLNFQKSIIASYDQDVPETEGNWLRMRLKQINMQSQNNFYFRKLWNHPSETDTFFQSVSGISMEYTMERSEIAVWVTQILSSGTQEEWTVVWDDLTLYYEEMDVLCIFHDALRTIAKAVEGSRTPATRSCLFYCIQNLIHVVRYKYFSNPMTERQVISAVFTLSKFLRETSPDDVNEIGSRILPLIAYIAENRHLYAFEVRNYFRTTNYNNLVCKAFGDNVSNTQ
ncbi:unnamed protein product [Chrysodeixis includens]|uniref:Uncharacterized protein n=1 Tax=Chrysodeixis includens TaxID=689277 RepID=A0A9P0BXZ6_CHRIL|nr:unnamed protein product [Chrysodeixis includens]